MAHYGPEHGQPPFPYQQQPQPPYVQYGPPQQPQPPMPPAPPRSQALAVTALVIGVTGCGLAILPPTRGLAVIAGFVAAVLGIVALVSKRQGGTMLAAGGLAAGLAALPLAFVLWSITAGQDSVQQQRELQACIEADPEAVLECGGLK